MAGGVALWLAGFDAEAATQSDTTLMIFRLVYVAPRHHVRVGGAADTPGLPPDRGKTPGKPSGSCWSGSRISGCPLRK